MGKRNQTESHVIGVRWGADEYGLRMYLCTPPNSNYSAIDLPWLVRHGEEEAQQQIKIELWECEIDPQKSLFFYWKISVFLGQNLL